eukprot:3280243-Amphidinium_carterae.1
MWPTCNVLGATTAAEPTQPAIIKPVTDPSALLGDLTQLYAASSAAPSLGALGGPAAPCQSSAPSGPAGFNALTANCNQQ